MTTLQVLPQPSPFGAGSVPAAALVGPLDVVPGAVFAIGHRALTSGWLGMPLYTLRRDTDDTEQVFYTDGTTGEPPTAAISAFISGGLGWFRNWNDQAGGSFDVFQDNTVQQAQWLASVLNSKPGSFSDIADYAAATPTGGTGMGIDFPNGGATIFVVGNADVEIQLLTFDGHYLDLYTGATGGHLAYIDLNDSQNDAEGNYPVLTSAIKIVDATATQDTTNFRVNGVSSVLGSNGSFGTDPINPILGMRATVRVHANVDAGTPNSKLLEVIVYPSVLSDANRLLVRQNIATYYGITLP